VSRFRPRRTVSQALRARIPLDQRLNEWPPATVPRLLELLWTAYDRVKVGKLAHIDLATDDLQLERSIAELLHDEVQILLRQETGGYASFLITQERFEHETLDPRSNRPPQYDLAFIWPEDATLMWPCEAKVLKTPGAVAPYLHDVREAFLACVYAPFSSSGAMLGLLASGSPEQALQTVAAKLPATLDKCSPHFDRPHRISVHARAVPAGKSYSQEFTLHHLILELSA
jgi:hypothetical protein